MATKKISYKEMKKLFCNIEENGNGVHLTGAIVFTEDSFNQQYPLESRTYLVSSNNKIFKWNMGGRSLFGSSQDGTDKFVRLDYYMKEEHGGKNGWKVDYCYVVNTQDEGKEG